MSEKNPHTQAKKVAMVPFVGATIGKSNGTMARNNENDVGRGQINKKWNQRREIQNQEKGKKRKKR